jgi:hypothetical protein
LEITVNATMPLVQACATLGKSYNATLRLVLTRVIRGEQRDGRWFCDPVDVARLSAKPKTAPVEAAS